MNIKYALLITLLSGLSTFIGSFIIFFKIRKNYLNKFISFSLSFSLSVMIMMSLLELLPSAIINIISVMKFKSIIIIIFLIFIICILITYLLSQIKLGNNSLYKVGILSMIVLIIHNIPEGMLTFITSVESPSLGIKIATAIALHNIPEGMIIAVPIYYASLSRKSALIKVLIASLSEVTGALVAWIVLGSIINNTTISIIMIFVAGIMITLAIEDIFPEARKYNEYKYMIYGLLLGIIIVNITILL